MTHAATASPVLQVQDLRFAHPGQPPLFDGLDFALPAGLVRLDAETGKTTLLRLLAGALPGRGRFTLRGAVWQPGGGAGEVCWLDPRDPAWDALTPDALVQALRPRFAGFDDAAWQRHLDGFALREHGHKTLHMLSTGSRRKVTLAFALAAGAPLTLLDEATAGLDQPATAWLAQALAAQAGAAVADAAAGRPGRTWLLAAAWGLEPRLPWAAVLAL